MNWTNRSRENYDAARHCEAGGYRAAAVTRYYYASYQAALELFEQFGPDAPEEADGAQYWPHRVIGRQLRDLLPDATDLALDYRLLMGRRVLSDYRVDPISENDCRTSREAADRVLAILWEAVKRED